MSEVSPHQVTQLLVSYRNGNKAALDLLTPLIYQECRKLAAGYMQRERLDHTLQPTALVHEAYMRLIDQSLPEFRNRSHFFGVAAQIMRQVLVDFARQHSSQKRGSGNKLQLDDNLQVTAEDASDFLDLNNAIEKLKEWDERKCRVIELRYFGGLGREEIAEVTGLTVPTIKRDLALAEAFLRRELGQAPKPNGTPGVST